MQYLTILFCLLLVSACGTTTGNPTSGGQSLVSMKVDAASMALSAALPSTVQLKICLNEMSFVGPAGEVKAVPVAANSGILTPIAAEIDLGTYSITSSSYQTVKIPLSNNCHSGHSVEVTRPDGTLATSDAVALTFDGSYDLSNVDTATVSLNFGNVITSVAQAQKNSELKGDLESSHGKGTVPSKTEKNSGNENGNGQGNGNGNGKGKGHSGNQN